jgi:hypothetical protein
MVKLRMVFMASPDSAFEPEIHFESNPTSFPDFFACIGIRRASLAAIRAFRSLPAVADHASMSGSREG